MSEQKEQRAIARWWREGIGFTPAERRVLIFLVAVLTVGSGLSLFGKSLAPEVSRTAIVAERGAETPFGEVYPAETLLARLGAQEGVPPPIRVVDVNHASAVELETLPGIGPTKAEAIVRYRGAHGPFKRVEDLSRVSGIGPKTLERLRAYVTCSPDSTRR